MEWLSSLGPVGTVLRFLIILLEVLLVFNLLILVHEWGHFLAARWRGLKVEKFYIWFGKPLWKKTINGVEYGLGSVPCGGFVALPQMAPMGGIEGETLTGEPLPPITPLDKIIVAFAGPLFSFMLAIFFSLLVWQIGIPDRRIHTTTIGWVQPDSPGDKAGLKAGDKILAIDGTPVHSWDEPVDSVIERIAFSKEDTIVFTVERPGAPKTLDLASKFNVEPGGLFTRRGIRKVGLLWSYTAQIYEVLPGSGAEKAGLKKGDRITAINGNPVYGPQSVHGFFEKNPANPAKLTIQRDGKPQDVTLTPLKPVKPEALPEEALGIGLTGINFENAGNTREDTTVTLLPSQQITNAVIMMGRTFGAVFGSKGDVGIQQMGGPVKIFSTYYQLFTFPSGWKLVLWFSVVLNVNLALMNLVPFPVFDGGHIVMALIEMVRRKSALPLQIMEKVQMACVIMLLCFFFYVTWFDSFDLLGTGQKKDKEVPLKIEDIKYSAAQ